MPGMKSLPLPEVTALMDKLPVKYRAIIAIGVTTGCRITEILSLRRFDLLTSKELAAATSFPENYLFAGSDTDAKKQIGNAVPPVLTEALYRAFLAA